MKFIKKIIYSILKIEEKKVNENDFEKKHNAKTVCEDFEKENKKINLDLIRKSKTQDVKLHLIKHRTIDDFTAKKLYNANNLKDIIYRLRKTGLNITTESKSNVSENGKIFHTTSFYKLN